MTLSSLSVFLCVLCAFVVQERPAQVPLWKGDAPGAMGKEAVDIPSIQVYRPPADRANGAAVVVCPGGGYQVLAEHEGHPIAQWLNSLGITAVVLKYRLGPRYHHPTPLQDAQRALRTVRFNAADWKVDPSRVGIMGFSAGGHLASTLSTHFDSGTATATDAVDRLSCRPDFAILCYPVITLTESFTHAGSRRNLLGDNPSLELMQSLSNERQVTAATPPTFIFHTAEDTAVPPQHSLLYVLALKKAGVPCEMHLYEKGRHGVGLAQADPILKTWPDLCAAWLRSRALVR